MGSDEVWTVTNTDAAACILDYFGQFGVSLVVPGFSTLGEDDAEKMILHALDRRRSRTQPPEGLEWIVEDEE